MEPLSDFLLKVWMQVSRHVRIEETLFALDPLLRARFSSDLLGVLRVDMAHQRLQAAWGSEPSAARAVHQRDLTERQLKDLLAWGRRGNVLRTGQPATDRALLDLLNLVGAADLMAGPLADDDGVHGVFVASATRPQTFDSSHEPLVKALLEPLVVALENDRRVIELSSLREAAEADRQSLLRRLGRDAIVDDIVGAESGLKAVMERVDMVAPSDVPVLILGETGSGKEVIARAIHQRSPRRDKPFLRINCGAIPPELVDSELFGHEKGSFTGATSLRKGWFERADGGSLFLDEVAELPLAAQVRLLRVLQDGTFERVGGQQSLTGDVRVIAATHPELQNRVAAGQFRQDLWYRIAVFPIELPPLRDRPEDLEPLANHFAKRAARRFGFRPLTITADDLAALLAYSWPGNARELAAVMDRAVILGQGRRLEVMTALGMPLGPGGAGTNGAQPSSAANGAADGPAAGRLDDVVRAHIEHVLALTRGKIEGPGGAAEMLGVNPHTLRARMNKLRIDWSQFRRSSR